LRADGQDTSRLTEKVCDPGLAVRPRDSLGMPSGKVRGILEMCGDRIGRRID
jgi:hypothetical protein